MERGLGLVCWRLLLLSRSVFLTVAISSGPEAIWDKFRLGPGAAARTLGHGANATQGFKVVCNGQRGPSLTYPSFSSSGRRDSMERWSQCYACRDQRTMHKLETPFLLSESCSEVHLLCPSTVPIALLTNFKAASMSVADWVFNMDRLAHDADVSTWVQLAGAFNYGELSKRIAATVRAKYPECYADMSVAELKDWAFAVFGRQQADHLACSGLLAHQCSPCCGAGTNRQIVVVMRNPYSRLLSLFKYELGHWNYTLFVPWVRGITQPPRVWAAALRVAAAEIRMGRSTYIHRMVVSALADAGLPPAQLSSEIQSAAGGAVVPQLPPKLTSSYAVSFAMSYAERAEIMGVDLKTVEVVRVEQQEEDLARLSRTMCQQGNVCQALPSLPRRNQWGRADESRNAWRSHRNFGRVRWTPELVALVRRRYRDDFVLGGYSPEPP